MIEKDAKRAIALGYFDGVHCGHQALMRLAVQRAQENGAVSSVFTFDVHPDTVITGQPVPLITSEARRRDEIRELGGVDEVIFGHFNDEMRNMDWRRFVDDVLVGQFHACWIITGENNRFGYRGQGTPERLRAALSGMAKSAFFLLQDAAWLETGVFAETRRELLPLLSAQDARLLKLDEAASLDDAMDALLTACRGLMERI